MTKSELRLSLTPLFRILDVLLVPFTLLASFLLFAIRKMRVSVMPISKAIFKKIGVFPIVDHYYEPFFNDKYLKRPLDIDRNLPGLTWNDQEQLALLHYREELAAIPYKRPADQLSFFYENPSFGPADAEYLYCMIRHFKPARIIEIGSGYSTLMARQAIKTNTSEDDSYKCSHICIEPYEMPWLEKTGVEVIRKLVEEMDLSFFGSLGKNDILFIDSSHMVRPQGDVLFEVLEILPSLAPGVIIHVHDIFSPRDYGRNLLVDEVFFWNEQYLLEAFLTCNDRFRIIGALNYLKNRYPEKMFSRLPLLDRYQAHVPGSFWIAKN
jgi:predicted O-methyltransferase YrrM